MADRFAQYPDLAGRVALVTGASRGIGCGIARHLARQKMRLMLTAIDPAGEAVAVELRQGGADCAYVTADLASADGAAKVVDAALRQFHTIDLLVNNAAVMVCKPIHELDEAAYRKTFESNTRMFMGPSHLVSRHMIAAGGGGCIVSISSVGGLRAHRDGAGYDASKGALDALTRSMAVDLAPHRIRVNAVAPGPVAVPELDTQDRVAMPERSRYLPLGRYAAVEDIAAAVAFLASDAAGYITGQILYVDGGVTAQLSPPGIWV